MRVEPSSTALLDVRREEDFAAGHAPDAANIPLEELARSSHELPSRTALIRVTDSDSSRAAAAQAILARRGNPIEIVSLTSLSLSATGPASVRLWAPNPFLLEAFGQITITPNARALDVACGSGRDAVWLAMQGMQVDAMDHLADGLQRADALARRNRVIIRTLLKDIETDPTLPTGYDLVCVFRYLHRPLWPALRNAVKPNGYVVYETFHVCTRENGGRPSSPNHLLETGELAAAFHGFQIFISRDCVERDGRYFSSLLARKKPV